MGENFLRTYIENPVFAKFGGTFPDILLKETSLLLRKTFKLELRNCRMIKEVQLGISKDIRECPLVLIIFWFSQQHDIQVGLQY